MDICQSRSGEQSTSNPFSFVCHFVESCPCSGRAETIANSSGFFRRIIFLNLQPGVITANRAYCAAALS
jgi:hypothetical protein